MREILFKAKRLDNGEWVEGFYVHANKYYEDLADSHFIVEHGEFEYDNYARYEVDPSTVGQFTGLCDKNGKRIFEGDIVDASSQWWNASGPAGHDSPIIPVKWDKYICGFTPFADYDCDCGVYINAGGCEVIGNIHDNPELLEGEG